MSVSATSVAKINPFFRRGSQDPIGQIIGIGTVTGDATGGTASITITFPTNMAILMQGGNIHGNLAADQDMHLGFTTGITIDGASDSWLHTELAVTAGGFEAVVFNPPRFLILPDAGVAPVWVGTVANVDTEVTFLKCRALCWQRDFFLQNSPMAIQGLL